MSVTDQPDNDPIMLTQQQANPGQDLICHGVRILAAALTRVETSSPGVDTETDAMIMLGLVDCLLRFLKGSIRQVMMKTRTLISPVLEPISPSTPVSYIPNGVLLADRLLALISAALSTPGNMMAANLGSLCFKALLEASLHSQEVWSQFNSKQEAAVILQMLLLSDAAYMVREDAADAIRALCGTLPTYVLLLGDFYKATSNQSKQTYRYISPRADLILLEIPRQISANRSRSWAPGATILRYFARSL